MERADRSLAVAFDVDLGELVDGHRVVARGLDFGAEGAVLHYEFVPAIERREERDKGAFFWFWILGAEDDLGTHYEDWNSGAFDDTTTGAASHGERDLGGHVPTGARRLTLRFEPGPEFVPSAEWRRSLVVDLTLGQVIESE